MRGIIVCEESQAVCTAFRNQGHEFFSCDLQPCSGEHPEWHIQGDAIEALLMEKWDFVGAHPPCTYLTNAGSKWLYNADKTRNRERWRNMFAAANFFNEIKEYIVENEIKGYIENPIPHKWARIHIGMYDQIIQPYQFGHPERKATCFWLYNLEPLVHTNDVKHIMDELPRSEQQKIFFMSPGPERTKLRSKTFSGIAEAKANQWGNIL